MIAEKPPARRKRSGLRSLTKGKPRLLGRHNGWRGREYDREWVRHDGERLESEQLRQSLGRVCVRRVRWLVALQELEVAERLRETGKGRRPSERVTLRLSRREEKADIRYQGALAEFWEMVKRHEGRPTSGPALWSQLNRKTPA